MKRFLPSVQTHPRLGVLWNLTLVFTPSAPSATGLFLDVDMETVAFVFDTVPSLRAVQVEDGVLDKVELGIFRKQRKDIIVHQEALPAYADYERRQRRKITRRTYGWW